MSVRVVTLLLLPLLCTAHSARYRSPPLTCPRDICVCSTAEATTGKFQKDQVQAICREIPRQRLTKTITSLQVTGHIAKVTESMIANLGGELLSLDLSNCEVESIEPGSFDAAPKLVKLKLSDNLIEEIGPGVFKKNRALRELYLDGNRLKHIDESAFSKLEQLRELHVERNFLTQFPSKIPIDLSVLNVSQNNLGPEFSCDIRETNLKDLDLCGNHLKQIDNSTLHALNKLQHLCIGDLAVHFPSNMASYLPHLAELALVASTETHAVLDSTTQTALANMGTLTSLTIVNYKIESLTFLRGLTKLRYLNLRDITTTHMVDFQSMMLSKTSLVVLNLEESYDLAHTLLDNMQVLGTLTSLHTISFRKTNITHLAAFDVPHTNYTHLDISNNPLMCDCEFAWLRNDRQNVSVKYTLLNSDETVCAEPPEFAGHKLVDIIHNLDCQGTQRLHPVNRRYSNRRKPTTTTLAPNDEYGPHSQPGYGHPGTPVRFPSHPPAGAASEFPNYGNPPIGGRPVKFPSHPNKGGEDKYPINPDQEEGSEYPTYPEQGKEPEQPINPDQGEEPEHPTNPEQGEEPEHPTNPEQGEEPEHPTNPEQGEEPENPENHNEVTETTTMTQTNDKFEENEPSVEPTMEFSHGKPEYMPIHEDGSVEDDASNIVYIILGTLLGLLILVGVVLSIFYWKFKKNSPNKVEPENAMPSATDATPTEPTYQQLQHTEGSSLLHNVKK